MVWWNYVVLQTWDDQEWLQIFQESRQTSLRLCEELALPLGTKESISTKGDVTGYL